jgi:ER membrane protein complex subunit 1
MLIPVAAKNSKIHSLPRRFLDPRRPNRKPTSEEVEEQLIQYEPVLQDHPQRVLSHSYEVRKIFIAILSCRYSFLCIRYQVANVKRIVTAPALLESTSLVFAYGLDLFLTRVSPSGTFDVLNENFNKVQLVLTIVALVVAIVITKPMVQRKRLRERWYQ